LKLVHTLFEEYYQKEERMMDRQKAFDRLEEIDRQIVMISHVGAVLSWDQELYAPAKASSERGREQGWLASEMHALSCGSEMGDLLASLDASPSKPEGCGRNDFEKALIRIRFKEWRRGKRLSDEVVRHISEVTTEGYSVWLQAREANDFGLFAPKLKEIVSLTRDKAEAWKTDGQSLYDALLDNYESGITTRDVDMLFSAVKPTLVSLVARSQQLLVDDSFLKVPYDVALQEKLADKVMHDMGFDFTRGLKAVSAHPFTSALGIEDVRITTRYTDPSVMDSFYSTVHESGHALYEQWASNGRQKGTSISGGASYAMHESQSRLWENIIGRSRPFLSHYYPLFKSLFPSQFEGVSLDRFYQAVNKVERSYIRTNSDEVSYSLHIMLRYELEKRMIEGTLGVDEIPEAWNAMSKELLGLDVPSCALGCLQDVHWATGDIGYFPTYALGNFYGAQIWARLNEEIPSASLLEKGEFGPIVSWLGEHVWKQGMLYEPKDLLYRLTGKGLDASYFTRYLEGKYAGGLES
jgi:carboxypeptidase Taq